MRWRLQPHSNRLSRRARQREARSRGARTRYLSNPRPRRRIDAVPRRNGARRSGLVAFIQVSCHMLRHLCLHPQDAVAKALVGIAETQPKSQAKDLLRLS
jgi:hypothetical protein